MPSVCSAMLRFAVILPEVGVHQPEGTRGGSHLGSRRAGSPRLLRLFVDYALRARLPSGELSWSFIPDSLPYSRGGGLSRGSSPRLGCKQPSISTRPSPGLESCPRAGKTQFKPQPRPVQLGGHENSFIFPIPSPRL